ncbi:MAG TPA: pseudaminic acid cytidylyltransferase [Bacteroidia bacterium]|nr:pseudaminic acid cytidylyltransferase [Bacteroidia bacterium]
MRAIAIITARGGSKRIPKKNIKFFLGKPIIQYSIEAALASKCFDEVMVSTDDDEIMAIAIKCGAKVPFLRSKKNADDFSTTTDVLVEVLNEYKKKGAEFKYACCLYPTAPFVTSDKLKDAFEKLASKNASSVIPIVKFSSPILRSLKTEGEFIKLNWPEHLNSRSQDLPPSFHDAGQFYFFNVSDFLQSKKLFADKTIGIEMPELEVQDIDIEEDWKLAEIKYTFQLQKKKTKN